MSALTVEISGFGLIQSVNPYALMVICVQQESFQAWTVYRRYQAFVELADQLRALHPTVPPVPVFNADDLSIDNLDRCRTAMDTWLQTISSNPMILRTQSMYQVRPPLKKARSSRPPLTPLPVSFCAWTRTCRRRTWRSTGATGPTTRSTRWRWTTCSRNTSTARCADPLARSPRSSLARLWTPTVVSNGVPMPRATCHVPVLRPSHNAPTRASHQMPCRAGG